MLPLEGLTVIAVEQAVAAPFCTSRLADAGANVIKIERPEGDFARAYDAAAKGQSSYFVWLNRGKKSVIIDLMTEEGRQSLETLIASADVLVQNLKPGSMDKLGFSRERLMTDYPSLISCTISGYGDEGPYAKRKAYDLLLQAESGLCSITGGPESPSRVGMSIVDVATGARVALQSLAPPGQQHDGRGRRQPLDGARDGPPVDLGHAEVRDDDIERRPAAQGVAEGLDACAAPDDGGDRMPAGLQHELERLEHERIVVDQQQPQRARDRRDRAVVGLRPPRVRSNPPAPSPRVRWRPGTMAGITTGAPRSSSAPAIRWKGCRIATASPLPRS